MMAFERKRKRKEEEEHMGELNLVPYLDIITNVVMFMLATITAMTTFAIVPVTAPTISEEGGEAEIEQKNEKEEESVTIAVGIGIAGFYVGTSKSSESEGPAKSNKKGEPDIPKVGDDYNFHALTQKMEEIKKQYPNETKVFITADPPIHYETLIATMDAIREKENVVLFPNVILTIVE